MCINGLLTQLLIMYHSYNRPKNRPEIIYRSTQNYLLFTYYEDIRVRISLYPTHLVYYNGKKNVVQNLDVNESVVIDY